MRRHGWALVAGVGAAGLGLVTAAALDIDAGASSAATLGALGYVVAGGWRGRLPTLLAAGAATVSLAVTAGTVLSRADPGPPVRLGLLELVALLALTALTARYAAGRRDVVVVAVLAVAAACWALRDLPDDRPPTVLTGLAASAAMALLAVAVGCYFRLADRRAARSVEAARAAQRRQLERDLHDYVAHDLSGIIARAQAATFAARDDPAGLRDALVSIEEAGQRAMDSMDMALELLRTGDDAPGHPEGEDSRRRSLADLPGLLDEFERVGSCRVERSFDLDPAVVHVAASATLYRVAVEALTNVRRHAPGAECVTVSLAASDDRLRLRLADTGAPPAGRTTTRRTTSAGGTGLSGLAARLEALGGTLTWGPVASGWTVDARLPKRPRAGG